MKTPLYPVILLPRGYINIFKSMLFPWDNLALISLLPVQVCELFILCHHWPILSGNRSGITELKWSNICSVCWHGRRGCSLTVIFNQRRSMFLKPVPKPQSNMLAAAERSVCLQQLSLSSRSSTGNRIPALYPPAEFYFRSKLILFCTLNCGLMLICEVKV